MVNFCSVGNCRNSSRNRPDLSFFCFPIDENVRRLWRNFCRRSYPEFRDQEHPRICSVHFDQHSIITKSIGGRRDLIPGTLPKYFNPLTPETKDSSRKKRLEERKKGRNESPLKTLRRELTSQLSLLRKTKIQVSQVMRHYFWTTTIVFKAMTREPKQTYLLKIYKF